MCLRTYDGVQWLGLAAFCGIRQPCKQHEVKKKDLGCTCKHRRMLHVDGITVYAIFRSTRFFGASHAVLALLWCTRP